jgi:hypothetical protein
MILVSVDHNMRERARAVVAMEKLKQKLVEKNQEDPLTATHGRPGHQTTRLSFNAPGR